MWPHARRWEHKGGYLFARFAGVFGVITLLVLGGMAALAFLLTRVFGGDDHTALLVWIGGCGLALMLPLLAGALGRHAFRRITSPLADVMDAAQDSFISSTYWTEGVGFAAALATIHKMQRIDVRAHVARIGTMLREGLLGLAEKHGLPLSCAGHAPLPCFSFEHEDNLALQTLCNLRMLERDILSNFAISVCLAHKEEHVERYLSAADEILPELAEALEKGDLKDRIGGPVRHTGFVRLA